MGYPRLDLNKQVELLPLMLNSLEGKPQQHQDRLASLLLYHFTVRKVLDEIHYHPYQMIIFSVLFHDNIAQAINREFLDIRFH